MPALVSGTSQEFIGEKPLPRVIRDRRMLFILGPGGVGKTTSPRPWLAKMPSRSRRAMSSAPSMSRPVPGSGRPISSMHRASCWSVPASSIADRRLENALRTLLRLRAGGGRRTVVVEAESGTSMERIMEAVHPGYRATIVLRFPVGRGRLRFAKRLCSDLGISDVSAKATTEIHPWTYAAVRAALTAHG